MNRLYEEFLKKRNLDTKKIEDLNNDSYKDLLDIDNMAKVLDETYRNHDKIVVLPDFDMDGIASSVIGYCALAEMGFNVSLYKRNPNIGYEFMKKDINLILKDNPNVKVIITCDVGISCYDAIEYAKSLGIKVLVTDHHKENKMKKSLMKADFVVNPNRVDESYENKFICGAFVFWQVLYYYAKHYRNKFLQDQVYRLRVFAGIGTISDNMALLYENRNLVRDMISILKMLDKGDEKESDYSFLAYDTKDEDLDDDFEFNEDLLYDNFDDTLLENIKDISKSLIYKRAFDGLSLILEVLRENGKITNAGIDENLVGFYIAPMFNSVRRLDSDMFMALDVFFAPSHVLRKTAACDLYDLNEERKEMVKDSLAEILEREQKFAPYIYFSNASSGVLGLLAMNLVKMTSLPTLVIRENDDGYGYKGSGRSEGWYKFLTSLLDNGYWASGHENAFGVGFTDLKEVKSCYTFLNKNVPEVLDELDEDTLEDVYDIYLSDIDKEGFNIDINEIRSFINLYENLKPFGPGFLEPRVKLTFDRSEAKFFKIGKEKQHLKIILNNGLGVLKWNDIEKYDELLVSNKIEVIGKLDVSEFMGNISVNMIGDSIRCLN